MKRLTHIIIGILICTSLQLAYSQNNNASQKMVLKTRAYQDSIVLRWVPKDLKAWHDINENGITVLRTNMATDKKEILTLRPLLPYTLSTWKTKTDTTNIFVATAAQCLLGKTKVTSTIADSHFSMRLLASKEQNNTLAFAAYSADFSTQAADGLAFRFVDTSVKSNNSYNYELQVAGKTVSNKAFQRSKDIWKPNKVSNVRIETKEGAIHIYWSKARNNSLFSGYYIERATEGKNFNRVSSSIIKATSQATYTQQQSYADIDVKVGVTYSYRIIGVTSFGDYGLYSEIVSATPKPKMMIATIDNLKVAASNDTTFLLSWKEPELQEHTKGYHITRNDTKEGRYERVSTSILPVGTTSFTDTPPNTQRAYFYKVISEGKDGKLLESSSSAGMLTDGKAPARPKGLTGTIDSLGVVAISWEFGEEKDLKGYRVYRTDDPQQEFRQLTKTPVPGNYYSDTLALASLKENVYYKIAAFDYNYNPSEHSELLVLKRPDFVKPIAPKIVKVSKENGAIQIRWKESPSKDVVTYRLYRKTYGQKDEEVIAEISSNTSSYTDDNTTSNTTYLYKLKAIDQNKNESIFGNVVSYNNTSQTLETPLLGGRFNKKTKCFDLNWSSSGNSAIKTLIFRNDGNGFTLYQTINTGNTNFSDTSFFETKKGYQYRIQWADSFGNESPISNIISITFK
ncbi:fibronectin type III domain-containing protein [Aquimarina spongiae]|uniref:Fibronectin type 3 domain-containing protein n=1 Tax=Aquimarina spongiae TaxID=570521 RepID=A0A1M6DTJ6_9FLAO|nr:hypothetical protein [Aquimarina spongiae]SHI76460.1 fibronectin type 3 domain-containing protein [Aquimarina spongiae]